MSSHFSRRSHYSSLRGHKDQQRSGQHMDRGTCLHGLDVMELSMETSRLELVAVDETRDVHDLLPGDGVPA
jgi:hypothetical protein